MGEEEIKILLDSATAEELEEKARESGFDTSAEYILFVIKEMLGSEGQAYTDEEEEAIKNNLQDLGYI